MDNEYSSSNNNRECKERQRCRRVAGQRRGDPNKRTEQSGSTSSILSSTTLLLGLASLASMTSPIAAASLHTPDLRSGFITRRKRRGSGERKQRRVQTKDLNNNILDKRNRSGSKFFNSLINHHTFNIPPDRKSPKTIAAENYDPSSYVSGTLILPEYDIGEPVWIWTPIGWNRATVKNNVLCTTYGLYEVKILDPDKVGMPIMFRGGLHVLHRNDGVTQVLRRDDEVQTELDDQNVINNTGGTVSNEHPEDPLERDDNCVLRRDDEVQTKQDDPNFINSMGVTVSNQHPKDPLECDDNWWKNFFGSFESRSETTDRDFLLPLIRSIRKMDVDKERSWLMRWFQYETSNWGGNRPKIIRLIKNKIKSNERFREKMIVQNKTVSFVESTDENTLPPSGLLHGLLGKAKTKTVIKLRFQQFDTVNVRKKVKLNLLNACRSNSNTPKWVTDFVEGFDPVQSRIKISKKREHQDTDTSVNQQRQQQRKPGRDTRKERKSGRDTRVNRQRKPGRDTRKKRSNDSHRSLHSFWWKHKDKSAQLSACCVAHEASGTSTWDASDVQHHCRPVSDKQILEAVQQYEKAIADATTDHTCAACGCRGGKRHTEVGIDFMWPFRLPNPEQVHDSDPSRWAEFCREETDSVENGSLKQAAIARLKRDMLTTTVLTDVKGTKQIYHLNENGINTDVRHPHTHSCNLCEICHTQIKTLHKIKTKSIETCTKKGIRIGDDTTWFITSKLLMEPLLSKDVAKCPHDDNVFVLRSPGNTYLKFDPGQRLNMYIDDDNKRQPVPQLSELERTALALSVVSMSIDKWSSASVKAGPIKVRGHCIVFPVTIQDGFKRETCLPRRDLSEWHRILYTGAPRTFSETLAGRLNVTKWAMRYPRVRKALISLKQTHPLYENIKISSVEECEWQKQEDGMLGHTWRVRSKNTAERDAAIGSDVAMPAGTKEKSDVATWETLMVADLGTGAEDEADCLLRAATFGKAKIGSTPLNEFRDTPRIIAGSFPTLFPLGIRPCDWSGDGPPGVTLTKRLLKLADGRVAKCPRLLIHLGNMKMRCAALRGVKMKVKHAKAAKVLELLNEKNFDEDLAEARTNPKSKMRSKILKVLKPIVELCGRNVPWGPFERKNATSHMYAFVHHFGYPSLFVTFSPKAQFNKTVITLSKMQTEKNVWSKPHEFEVTMPSKVTTRLKNLDNNPVAQARAYKAIMKAVVSFLFGMDAAGKESRKTKEPKIGIFGRCNAYYGVTETQKRNGLHGHFLLWSKALDPRLIQRLSNNPELLTHIISLIDSVSVGSAAGFDDVHAGTTTADSDLKNGRNPVTDNDEMMTHPTPPKKVVPGLRFYHRHVGITSLPYNGWMQVVDQPSPKPGHHWVCCLDDNTNKQLLNMPGHNSWNGLKRTATDGTQHILWDDADILCSVDVGEVYKRGHEVIRRFNIHGRDPHSRSCHKRKHAYDAKYCRMCFPRPCDCDTGLTHLVNVAPAPDGDDDNDSNDGLKVELGTVVPPAPPPCSDTHPWDTSYYDDRVLTLDIKRRWSRVDRKPVINRNSMMLCRVLRNQKFGGTPLRNVVQHTISFLHGSKSGTDDNVICETSPPLSACVKSNANNQVLGGLVQAKAAMFYLTSYLSKNPVKPEHWITCTSAARNSSLNTTSTADDVGSNPLRQLIFFVQKVVNRLHGNIEIADTQIASLLLGMDSFSSSHDFQYCYVWPAVHYQIRKSVNLDDEDVDSDNDSDKECGDDGDRDTDTSQRSGEPPEADSYDLRGGFKDVYDIPDNSSHNPDATKKVLVSQTDNYRYRCRQWNVPDEVTTKLKVTIGGKDFHWPSLQYVYARHATDQHVLSRVECTAEMNSGLRWLNLLEYSRHVRIEKMPVNPELSGKILYYFNLDHPLAFTHVQVLDPKHKVAILAGTVPRIPKEVVEEMRKGYFKHGDKHHPSLDKYARYMGTLLCPWDAEGRCEVETWADFELKRKKWVKQVSEIVQSDRDWERHCVLMNKASGVDVLQSMEKAMVHQPFPDPRPLHYLMVDRNIRLNMKTSLESAILVKEWRSRAADWFSHAEKANASRKWDSTFSSGGDSNPNSANSKLLHKLLDKVTSGYLNAGVNDATREQIDNLLEILGQCMPQHDDDADRSQRPDNSQLDWRTYSPAWAKQRLQQIKLGNQGSKSLQKCIGSKRDRLQSIEDLRCGLSTSQLTAFNKAVFVMNPEEKSFSGEPLRMFVHGGPGTGKSHLIEKIKDFAGLYGKSVKCMSISGSAAKLIGGGTCHSAAALQIALPREGDLNEPRQRQRVQKKMRDKQKEPVWLYIIDEISMMDADLFAILSERIGLLHSSPGGLNRKLSFGGAHVIIVGDMLQIGAVKQTSLHKDCVDMAMGQLHRDNCRQRRMYGIELFQQFQKFELKPHENGRSQDPQHSLNIKQMREGRQPITRQLLSYYKRLSAEDVQNDSAFEFAPLLTPTNVERASVNKNAAIRFARKHGLPVLFWVDQYGKVPAAVRRRCPNELTIMSEKYFVVGAPCMVTKNLQPTEITGVVNGSRGVLHSLSWSDGYQVPSGWEPGDIVKVPVPSHVNVLLDEETHDNGGILPCAANTRAIRVGGANLNMRQHPVTLLFAVTPFKVQGQTTPRLILDLRYKQGKALRNLGFEDIYVAISRIALAGHLRIITSSGDKTDHITRLRRPAHFSSWMKCYTSDGIFDGSKLRELGKKERAQALKTVGKWSNKDLRHQKRSRLLLLARKLGLPVKRSGRGNQPIKEDAWNALFPIWKAANPTRSSYKSRQETLHDQNVVKKVAAAASLSTKTTPPITPKKRKYGPTTERFKTPRHPVNKKRRKPGSRSSGKNKSTGSHSQPHKKRKSTNNVSSCTTRLRFNTNTRPPSLDNHRNMCYINAGLQALSGSPVITTCARRTKNMGKSTFLIEALDSVSSNSSRADVNMHILRCINKDEVLREQFNITGHLIPDVDDSLKVPQQPADVLAQTCLHRMTQMGCVQTGDLCGYISSVKCVTCENTHGQERSTVIPVLPGRNVTDYIHGFPYTTTMDGNDRVNCIVCEQRTAHIKKEELCTNQSSTVIMVCNRQDNDYKDLTIPEFLKMEGNGIKTHQIVGVTVHKPGHFIALRKYNGKWYCCNDNRITELPQNGEIRFNGHTYTLTNGIPLILVSTHGTMIVYDKIIE